MGLFRRKPKVEERDWLSDSWSLPERTPFFSTAGPWVDTSSTLGLSTAGAAIKLVSESIGMMPLKVYRGEKPDQAEARDSWQWYRLKEAPNEEQSAYDFWQDAAASIETAGNTFIWKAIARRPVQDEGDIEFYLLDPANVFVKRDKGKKYYEVRRNGQTERVPASQILHIRGWTSPPGSDVGLSSIALHRETIGAALAARDYQSRFYSQGTTLPGFIVTPGSPKQEDVDRLSIEWQQRHTGLQNAHRPGILANGATWVPTGISMRDAQYIETQRFSAEEVCRICRVTPGMLGIVQGASAMGQSTANDDFDRFLQADLGPRLRRIEMALTRDPDLFPTGNDLFPEFLTAAVLKPSMTTRYAAYKDARQGGWQTANGIRALENLPPLQGGDELQQTPVGGAPNTSGTENVPSDA
jgi:HK97 family phage portal protein